MLFLTTIYFSVGILLFYYGWNLWLLPLVSVWSCALVPLHPLATLHFLFSLFPCTGRLPQPLPLPLSWPLAAQKSLSSTESGSSVPSTACSWEGKSLLGRDSALGSWTIKATFSITKIISEI